MIGRGNFYDNSAIESFWGMLNYEWIHHHKYKTCSQARTDVFGFIEGFYNTIMLHSTLGYLSQVEFEGQY
jgi:putative transposase